MRAIILTHCLFTFVLNFSTAQHSHEQALLADINNHWNEIELTAEQVTQVRQCRDRHQLIRLHLKLVAEHLRNKTEALGLDKTTEANRLASLNALVNYYKRNLYPINTNLDYTTPIFVDDYGTHCAVGYLMHASGHDVLVKKIQQSNNLGYVAELDHRFEQVGQWAAEYGFSTDELAWIQPAYDPCVTDIEPGEIVHASCPNRCDGAFRADTDFIFPGSGCSYTFGSIYVWHGGEWVETNENPGWYPDCLCVGYYRQEIWVDCNAPDTGFIYYYEVEIGSPEPIQTEIEIIHTPGTCNNFIQATATGGTPPYTFNLWQAGVFYGQGPVCEGTYSFFTVDSLDCLATQTVEIVRPKIGCHSFCVTSTALDPVHTDQLNVELYFEGGSTDFINYPWISSVQDQHGDTVAFGTLNLFGQVGGTSQMYQLTTSLSVLPEGFTGTAVFNYDTVSCVLDFPCTATHVEDIRKVDMAVFPNPSRSEVLIQLEDLVTEGFVSVYSVQGQLIIRTRWESGNQYSLEVSSLPAGHYIIQVSTSEFVAVGKMVKVE